MIYTSGDKITMHSGDYGIPLPFQVFGDGEFIQTDKLRFLISRNGGEILHKDFVFGDIEDDAFILVFTQDESEKLTTGYYTWSMVLVREVPSEDAQHNTFKGPCILEVIGCDN